MIISWFSIWVYLSHETEAKPRWRTLQGRTTVEPSNRWGWKHTYFNTIYSYRKAWSNLNRYFSPSVLYKLLSAYRSSALHLIIYNKYRRHFYPPFARLLVIALKQNLIGSETSLLPLMSVCQLVCYLFCMSVN